MFKYLVSMWCISLCDRQKGCVWLMLNQSRLDFGIPERKRRTEAGVYFIIVWLLLFVQFFFHYPQVWVCYFISKTVLRTWLSCWQGMKSQSGKNLSCGWEKSQLNFVLVGKCTSCLPWVIMSYQMNFVHNLVNLCNKYRKLNFIR